MMISDLDGTSSNFAKRQIEAVRKISYQTTRVRRMNGKVKLHPGEQQILNEMRSNKALLDVNRAMIDYDQGRRPRRVRAS